MTLGAPSPWELVGWVGNACYFSRFLVQWWQSERTGRSVAPRVFWWLSLGGVLFLGGYTLSRALGPEPAAAILVPAYLINGAVYARNLWIDRSGAGASRLGPVPAALVGLAAAACVLAFGGWRPSSATEGDTSALWIVVGAAGQSVWSLRFILQWWFTERRGRSHFPLAFWWFSLLGSALNLSFTIHLGNPILIASYLPTPIYPVRNLMIERARRRRAARREPARGET